MALEGDYKSMCAMIRVLADHCGIDKNQDEFDLLYQIHKVVLANKIAVRAADDLLTTIVNVTPIASAVLTEDVLDDLDNNCQEYSSAREQIELVRSFANRRY